MKEDWTILAEWFRFCWDFKEWFAYFERVDWTKWLINLDWNFFWEEHGITWWYRFDKLWDFKEWFAYFERVDWT